jgi:hypothetical protein
MRMLALLMALAMAGTAQAVVLCARPRADGTYSTGIKLRETCKPSETQLDPAELGIQGPPGLPGPQGPAGGVVVVDANGVFVGTADELGGTDLGSEVSVVRTISGTPVRFPTTSAGFIQAAGPPTPYFETTDCTGTPFVPTPTTTALITIGQTVGTVAYYAELPFGPTTRRSDLLQRTEPECTAAGGTFTPPGSCCVPEPPAPGYGGALRTFDLATLGLVTPFRVVAP